MMRTGERLYCSMNLISFYGRSLLPSGQEVNIYHGFQRYSANQWYFYYYRGGRYYISEQDYGQSTKGGK